MDRAFSFFVRTRILFGRGMIRSLGAEVKNLGGKKAIVITDKGLVESGAVATACGFLEDAGVEHILFSDVSANPADSMIDQAAGLAKENKVDVVIGIGGGSSIDTAKAVAALQTNPGPVISYITGGKKIAGPILPVVAVPTTAGTGSEVTAVSVVTDSATKLKMVLGDPLLAPALAICDPELTLTVPPQVTAATGMDALTHAIESFTSTESNRVSDVLALDAIRRIGRHLRTAVARGDDIDARDNMLLASTEAGMAFLHTRLGIAHAIAMPLGSWDIGLPHGLANAIVLPRVIQFNTVANMEKFKAIADALGEDTDGLTLRDAAFCAVDAVENLMEDIGLPMSLSEVGVREDQIPMIARHAMESKNIAVNPKTPTVSDIEKLLREAL